MKPLGLYVHIPFCVRKCAYCDVASWPGREADMPRYTQALCREIARRGDALGRPQADTVFFGGNFAEVRIDTGADSDRVLLVLKDSYANCVIPMMTPFFKTIVLVDPRYYNDNLPDTIAKEGVTDLLWFYNVNTFLNDTSIGDKLG